MRYKIIEAWQTPKATRIMLKRIFLCSCHCLERCGYKMPPERKNNIDPVTKEEGVFDMINQTYLAMQEAFAKTVRNYPVYFEGKRV